MHNLFITGTSNQNINFNGVCMKKLMLRKEYLRDRVMNPRLLTKHDRELNYSCGAECGLKMKNESLSNMVSKFKEELTAGNLDFVKGFLESLDKKTKNILFSIIK